MLKQDQRSTAQLLFIQFQFITFSQSVTVSQYQSCHLVSICQFQPYTARLPVTQFWYTGFSHSF